MRERRDPATGRPDARGVGGRAERVGEVVAQALGVGALATAQRDDDDRGDEKCRDQKNARQRAVEDVLHDKSHKYRAARLEHPVEGERAQKRPSSG